MPANFRLIEPQKPLRRRRSLRLNHALSHPSRHRSEGSDSCFVQGEGQEQEKSNLLSYMVYVLVKGREHCSGPPEVIVKETGS